MGRVIALSGHQYLASIGDQFSVPGHLGTSGGDLTAPLLLSVRESQVEIGQPHLNSPATLKVLEHGQGQKIHVRTYKAKSRSRRHLGYRDQTTRVEVIALGVKSLTAPAQRTKPTQTKITPSTKRPKT